MNIESIKSYSPTNNRVLVRPIVDTSTFTYKTMTLHTGLSLADGKPYDLVKAAPIVCEVVAVPRKLTFGTYKDYYETVEELDVPQHIKVALAQVRKQALYTETTLIEKPVPGSMMWKTKMDVIPGDVVWCNATAMVVAQNGNLKWTVDGQDYFLMDYSDLYLRKRKDKDKVVCLNGYILCELIEYTPNWAKRIQKMGLFVPSHLRKEEYIDRFGVVRYVGDPVEYVLNDRYDHEGIKPGTVVMFKQKVNRRLEPGMKFFGSQEVDYIVTRRANIAAIMESSRDETGQQQAI